MCQIGVVQRQPGSKLEFLHFVAQWHSVTVAQWHRGTKWGLVKSLDRVIISVCKMDSFARWWRLGWSGWKQGAMLVEDFGDDHDVRPRLMMISPPKNMKMPMMTWNLSVQLVGGRVAAKPGVSLLSLLINRPLTWLGSLGKPDPAFH